MMQGFVAATQHFPPGSFELRLAGSGSQAHALAAQCQPLAPLVQWLGALPYSQIDAAFAQCHVAVMATRAEAFGMVAIEAMMHARLAMVSAVDALPELVQHQRTGWLVYGHSADDWAAAFQQVFALLLQQPHLYIQYCRQGRQHYLQHYQQQPQLQRLKELIVVKGA
jgi:glycosyltransferase involved in cell wall biosynthesis